MNPAADSLGLGYIDKMRFIVLPQAIRRILPPLGNPLRSEVESAAHDQGLVLSVPLEVEGVRLIADLVAAGAGVSIIPETAVPPREPGVRSFAITDMPPRRLALR